MHAAWIRIERWLRVNAPPVLENLRSGTTAAELRYAEQRLGVTLPDDVRAFYRLHNGQSNPDLGFIEGREFLSLARVVKYWCMWKDLLDKQVFAHDRSEPVGPIVADWWHACWIPLTDDCAGNHYCLDLAPARGGDCGQIITMWHDDPLREIVAPSFTAWLTAFADDLEQGAYVFLADRRQFCRVEDV